MTAAPPTVLLCFGFGFCARQFAARLGSGWEVVGTSRTPPPDGAGAAAPGVRILRFERGDPLPSTEPALADATHILVSVPPDAKGDPVADSHGDTIARLPRLAWLGYLSTTGVYGDTGGEWVDESSPVNPTSDRARRRVAAERTWLGLWKSQRVPVHIFRLAGIYGPGRSALDQLRAGAARRIDKPGHVFSRIHVDDVARVLKASISRPNPGAVYNVCDDEPAAQSDVVAYGAEVLGVTPPPLRSVADAGLSPMGRSFYAETRRVRNHRVKQELGVELAYPSYREGLAALAAGCQS